MSPARDKRSSALDLDRRRRASGRLPPPRQLVEPPTVDLPRGERGRNLVEAAHEPGERRPQRLVRQLDPARLAERLPRQVVGGGREAEPQRRTVRLLARGQEAREPRRAAEAQRQDARREGVERARVADAPRPERAARAVDDVVRRRAGGLVDDEDAVHGSRYSGSSPPSPASPLAVEARRRSSSSSCATRSVASRPLS